MTKRPTSWIEELMSTLPGMVQKDVSMESWTTFHCRGKAAAVCSPGGVEDLKRVLEFARSHSLPWRVIGRGSNLLIQDGGYPGLLVDLSQGFTTHSIRKETTGDVILDVGAGMGIGALLQWLREKHLKGFGFAFGIPGSIGGGIRMNAGTPLGWFSNVVERVRAVTEGGNEIDIEVRAEDFEYRNFPKARMWVITGGTFRFVKAAPPEVEAEIAAAKERRKNQPLEYPNIGSVFKNPPGSFAGKLIEDAGLKGLRVGDAQISERHANFIVNLGAAKTSDALSLMAKSREAVKKKFNIDLEPEVHVIGAQA